MPEVMRALKFRSARLVGAFSDADNVCILSKMMFLRELFRKLDIRTVIDVGANTGQFASSIRYVGYRGRIISIEPDPETYKLLQQRMSGDPDWRGINVAAGAVEENRIFNRTESTIYSSFRQPIDEQNGAARIVKTFPVSVMRLDSLIDGQELGNIFLKTDTQGFDLEVVQGLGERIRTISAIQCELAVRHDYADVPLMNDMVRFLEEHGFVPAFFAPVGSRSAGLGLGELDYICVRR